MTGRPELAEILRADGVAAALLGAAPAWVWDVAEGRILAASAAGIAFFGEPDLAALAARRFDMARPDLKPLARLGRALPRDGTGRLSLLRFYVGLRGLTVPCQCRLLAELGRDIVLVVAGAGATDATLADRFAAAFGSLSMPLVLRDGAGETLRNAAAEGSATLGTGMPVALPEGDCDLFLGETVPAAAAVEATPVEAATVAAAPPAGEAPPMSREAVRRFTFQIDADGRVAEIGAGLAAVVGPKSADVIGRPLADLAAGSAAEARLRRALATHDTWSNIEIDWPTDGGEIARLKLAALPRFGEGRAFAGFRGFADVVSITTPEPEPEAETVAEEPAVREVVAEEAEEAKRAVAGGEAKSAPKRPVLVPEPKPEADEAAGDVAFAEPEPSAARPEGSRVLRLHPFTPAPVESGALNEQERTAFKAIAEALGARWAGQPDAPEAESAKAGTSAPEAAKTAAAAPVAEKPDTGTAEPPKPRVVASEPPRTAPPRAPAPAAPPAGLIADILDRVPLGLAVIRDNKALAANRAFLELFGFTDLDDLEIAGGIGVLLEGRTGEEGGAVAARRRDGTAFRADVRLGRTPWIDGPAMLMSAREAAPPPEPDTVAGLTAEEYIAILDVAADGALLLDTDGTIFWTNEAAVRLLGADRDGLVGRRFAESVAPDDQDRFADLMKGLADGGLPSVLEQGREIALIRGGKPVPVEIGLSHIGSGAGLRVVAVLRDLSDWKASEAELVEARKRAEAASDQKSDFLAKMSHEIRTPLNGIIGFSEVILEERFGPIGNDRYRDYIKDIRASGGHLLSLVNDLLDLSKVEAGKMEMNFTGVRLNDLVEQSVAVMQPQSNRARVIIRTSLRRGLPAVVADTRSIRQVLLNILSNAIKFTQPGGQVIVSTALGDTGEVFLRVRDTGVGMSESDVATAMEPFRQLPTAPSTGERGTGLGLPLAKALTEANRATFALTSKPGEGTLVEIAFPQQRVLAE